MLQILKQYKKQINANRNEMLLQLDMKYMHHINSLLQQKCLISHKINQQYNEQLTVIQNLVPYTHTIPIIELTEQQHTLFIQKMNTVQNIQLKPVTLKNFLTSNTNANNIQSTTNAFAETKQTLQTVYTNVTNKENTLSTKEFTNRKYDQRWKDTLKVDQFIEVKQQNKWYIAKIMEISHRNNTMRVNYVGLQANCDLYNWINIGSQTLRQYLKNTNISDMKKHNEEMRRSIINNQTSRKYTTIACIKCWKAKTRCSVKRPCNRCVKIGCADGCIDRPETTPEKYVNRCIKKVKKQNEKHKVTQDQNHNSERKMRIKQTNDSTQVVLEMQSINRTKDAETYDILDTMKPGVKRKAGVMEKRIDDVEYSVKKRKFF